jgi:L-ascorbate metabolism protein UlaG (beta-lactamase superfamily)
MRMKRRFRRLRRRRRWFPPLLALRDLPPLDAVLLSHDHYDHLDYATIVALKDRNIPFVAPLGVGAHPHVAVDRRASYRASRFSAV